MKTLNGKPDFFLQLVGQYKIPVWNNDDHFVCILKIKSNDYSSSYPSYQEIIYAEKGMLDTDIKKQEVRFAIFNSLLEYTIIEDNENSKRLPTQL